MMNEVEQDLLTQEVEILRKRIRILEEEILTMQNKDFMVKRFNEMRSRALRYYRALKLIASPYCKNRRVHAIRVLKAEGVTI